MSGLDPTCGPDQVRLERQGALARVWLAHPGKFNAMSRRMWRQLRQVFEDLQADSSVRCVWVQGQDGHFCAGGDIAEYPGFRFDPVQLQAFHEQDVWGGLSAMLACDVPIVAQIEGNCMGAGVEIACCCDLRLAAHTARFGAPIARLGFPMAPREAQLVLREAGAASAREMLLTAAVLDAATLAQRGFLHQVLDAEVLSAHVATLVQGVLTLGPQAARLNKQCLRALAQGVAPDSAPMQANAYAYAPSDEHREGVMAFVQRRRPQF